MKTLTKQSKSHGRSAVLGLASLVLAAAPTHAAVSVNQGDLILGFRSGNQSGTNGTYNLEIALPSFSILDAAAVANGGTLDLNYGDAYFGITGGLSVDDLVTAYGSWSTNAQLRWSVFGHDAGPDAWATSSTAAAPGNAVAFQNATFDSRAATAVGALNGSLNLINGSALESPKAAGILDSVSGSYRTTVGTGSPFYGAFSVNPERVVNIATKTLTLWGYDDGTDAVTSLGQFSLQTDGNFTYTTFTTTPEPTSAALLGAVAIGALAIRRRRALTA